MVIHAFEHEKFNYVMQAYEEYENMKTLHRSQ